MPRNQAQEDENFKVYIRSEDDSKYIWRHNWGWILEEYRELKKDLDKISEQSAFLAGVKEDIKPDPRNLGRVPESVNHFYGWVAKQEDFRLQKYGSDCFKGLPLPEMYRVTEK